MRVEDVMSKRPRTCTESQSMSEAAQVMWEHDVGCVPIVGNDGRPVGMITDRDICMAAYTTGEPLAALPVARAMSRDLAACAADTPLQEAEKIMVDRQIRRLPVVDRAGALVGVLSLNDIALAARESSGRPGERLRGDLSMTLASICEHRTDSDHLHL